MIELHNIYPCFDRMTSLLRADKEGNLPSRLTVPYRGKFCFIPFPGSESAFFLGMDLNSYVIKVRIRVSLKHMDPVSISYN